MATSPARPSRRRQRSVRITVATLLLVLATAFAVAAIVEGSFIWLTSSTVVSLVCGWVSARVTYAEVVQSRRTAGADRAALAQEYRDLLDDRAQEHSRFTNALTDNLVLREREISELNGTLLLAERRAELAEERSRRETARADEVAARLADVVTRLGEEPELVVADHELEELETVVDLLRWEEKVVSQTTANEERSSRRKHA